MTTKELIEYLQQFPKDMRVMEHGYEGGFSDIDGGEVRRVALNVNTAWYYGKHDDAEDHPEKPSQDALIL